MTVRHGDVIRLEHVRTKKIPAQPLGLHLACNASAGVVTCFGGKHEEPDDENSHWRIEVQGGGVWKNNTPVRLIHLNTGRALHSHILSHPGPVRKQ